MKNRKIYGCLVSCKTFILLIAFLVGESYAATNQIGGFEKLVKQAEVIVVGEYTDVSSAWDKKKIYTTAIFQVEKVVKGKAENNVKIKVLGGTALHPRLKTPVSMNVSNGVNFTQGHHAVVFLKKNMDSSYHIVGMSNGNVPVLIDENSMKYMGGGLSKIASKQDSNTAETKIYQEKMSLDHFVGYIESLLRSTGENGQ